MSWRVVAAVWLTSMGSLVSFAAEGDGAQGPVWDMEKLSSRPAFRWLDETSPIRSLIYEGEKYEGHETEVFAFYATPGTIRGTPLDDKDLPAVVLVHGGGGTAFAEWVWLWAKRGYAVIAMDLAGRRPPAPRFDKTTRELIIEPAPAVQDRPRLKLAGPDQGYDRKFASVGGEVTGDWPFHALSAVIRAHSLIRGFSEVDRTRVAVTGISWGGFLTCLAAGVDSRFTAAVPVYGCGYLFEGESVQKPNLDMLEPALREQWIRQYDPSSYLSACITPIMFVNGTNDEHYPLNSYAKTYQLVQGPRQLRIEAGMRHSHPDGWQPKEIGLFIDSLCKGGVPLPMLSKPLLRGSQVVAHFESTVPVIKAALHYTLDQGPLVARKWQSTPAKVEDKRVSAAQPPSGTTIWFMTVTDNRDAMVSSEVIFVEPRNGQ